MKKVYGHIYFAVEAENEINKDFIEKYHEALNLVGDIPHNIVKIEDKEKNNIKKVSLLNYNNFEKTPHPFLSESYSIDLDKKEFKKRIYKNNQPILHRLELFLCSSNLRVNFLEKLTEKEERKGMYDKKYLSKIGRKNYWNDLCKEKKMFESISR